MHQRITHSGDVGVAYPLFGLNARKQNGILTVTARSGDSSASLFCAVLPFAPPGVVSAGGAIICSADPVGSPTVALALVSEGGICLDGVDLRDMSYIYLGPISSTVSGTSMEVDVSFTPTVTPVREVR